MAAGGLPAHRIYQINRELAALEGHAESSNGLVAAVVGVRHDVRSLRIDPRVYHRPDAGALAQDIVEAVGAACDDVDRQASQLAGPLLREGVADLAYDPILNVLDQLAGSGSTGSRW